MSIQPVKVGVIGCGAISDAYFTAKDVLPILDIVACADLMPERAQAKADQHGIPKACSVDDLLADPDVDVVLNLTIPNAHAEVNLRALQAGKHAYVEKPFAVTRTEGRKVLETAKARNLLLGCAPDTFMGEGIQTCRRLIDDGAIGTPIAATAFMMCHGHESWHPSPEFYYQVGGGPLFDMGPYYLTALVNLIGPIREVAGFHRITFPTRTITSEAKKGQTIEVETPTHISGLLDFANGAIGTIVMSFDVWKHSLPCIEIHGTEGSLRVPDPNTFGGQVELAKAGGQFEEQPHTLGHPEYQRGAGLADMCYAIRSGRPHRASGELAYHVLDAMQSMLEAGERREAMELVSKAKRPAAIPDGLAKGELDA